MKTSFVAASVDGYAPEIDENINESIFKQYENVIIQSIITSFSLDFLVHDKHGGDVDTVHNVRQIDNDSNLSYKNTANQQAYQNRGEYDSHSYHSHSGYKEKNREVSDLKKNGLLFDDYTGEKYARNAKTDLDHTISAKEIHEDRGRVLSNLKGEDLANSPKNLNVTNQSLNRSKRADSMDDYLDREKQGLSESQKENMREKDKLARKSVDKQIEKEYYTSSRFMNDTMAAASKVGVGMGIRQALGLVFTEMWFSVKYEFQKNNGSRDFKDIICAIGNGVKRGLENAKQKYKQILAKFGEGFISGTLASITTTICNIFFTTAKRFVKIIRETWASLVEATKVLLINPEGLPFGERIRSVTKILATAASIIVGTTVSEAIDKAITIPILGEIVSTFCGTFVTGIMTCTFLHYLDTSTLINKLVSMLNSFDIIGSASLYFKKQAEYLTKYAAQLMEIDLEKFKAETEKFNKAVTQIFNASTPQELNTALKNTYKELNISSPWGERSFDDFMRDPNARLKFK